MTELERLIIDYGEHTRWAGYYSEGEKAHRKNADAVATLQQIKDVLDAQSMVPDWSDSQLNIHPDFAAQYERFLLDWNNALPTTDMKSLCFYFFRRGAEPVNADKMLVRVMASLAAAISLLERSSKKAAPSNKMFDIMLDDYRASLEAARNYLKGTDNGTEST